MNIQTDMVFPEGAIVLINVVKLAKSSQDDAIEILRDTVNYVSRSYEGFLWSRLFKSHDGETVVNQAIWKSEAEFNALFTDDQFLTRYNALKRVGTWEYHLYSEITLIESPFHD